MIRNLSNFVWMNVGTMELETSFCAPWMGKRWFAAYNIQHSLFRFFISREGSSGKPTAFEPHPEAVAKLEPFLYTCMVCLSITSGYTTIPLLYCILDEFSKWRSQHLEGLNCYLVCGKLYLQVGKTINQFANA